MDKINDLPELISLIKDLTNKVNHLTYKVDKLTNENNGLKNNKKKVDLLELLNNNIIQPPITFQHWIDTLQYTKFLQTIFKTDLLNGIIQLLEDGKNNISLLDNERLPMRVFNKKQNIFYIFDNNNNKPNWKPIHNKEFDRYLNEIAHKFLLEFKYWMHENEEEIFTNINTREKYMEYLQKMLGTDLHITDDGRNKRIKEHIIKMIKQDIDE
jgi:hypothetical protein